MEKSETQWLVPRIRKFTEIFLFKLASAIYKISGRMLTYEIFDIDAHTGSDEVFDISAKYGVVIQGPVIPITTYKVYKRLRISYPYMHVVLSTWAGTDLSEFGSLSDENLHIVITQAPQNPGISNVNMQIVSSRAGIAVLEKLDCTHILKTRTDVLFKSQNIISYLHSMLNKGESRAIVFSSFNSFLFRLYTPSDQLQFGKVEQIALYWAAPLVDSATAITYPEEYLFKNYLRSNKFEIEDTLAGYWNALSSFAVIADHSELGQVWNKGTFTALEARWRDHIFPNAMTPLSRWYWELIKENPEYLQSMAKKIF